MTLLDKLNHNKSLYLGYPTSTDFNNLTESYLLKQHLNNIGNPYKSTSAFGSFEHEKEVINFFLRLYNSSSNNSWGYIANCSTEAILYSAWTYRKYSKKKIAIISSDYSHYCIDKVANILNISTIKIKSDTTGAMDMDELEKYLKQNKDTAILFIATCGSTITGSKDDYKKAKKIISKYTDEYYIHVDAALDGVYIPLIENLELGKDFNSINISGHKFLGCSIPSGILLIEKEFIEPEYIEYIYTDDITLGGSRNGLTPVLLYETIKKIGKEKGILEKYNECLKRKHKFIKLLKDNQIKCWSNSGSITIVLEDINYELFKKWHLPKYKNQSTITCLPKVTELMVNNFINDNNNPHKIKQEDCKILEYYIDPL